MKSKNDWMIAATIIVLVTAYLPAQQTIEYQHFPKNQMVLFSVPLNFENSDPNAVLGAVFGDGGAGQWWRFSRWNIGAHTYFRYGEMEWLWNHASLQYVELTEQGNPPDLQPGLGYWLAQSSANTVDNFSLTGTPVAQDQPYYIPVDPPQLILGVEYAGLSMVGNPFLYSVDWANSGVRINGVQEVTLAQAVHMGLLSQYSYGWDREQYQPYNMTDGGRFEQWDGFWVEQLNPAETEYVVYQVDCAIEGNSEGGEGCGSCPDDDYGMLRYLQLRFDGDQAAQICIYDHFYRTLFNQTVDPGEIFDFYGLFNRQGLGPQIYLYGMYADKCVPPDIYVEIHTSCSVTLGVGQQWGLFTIMYGENKDGIPLCPLEAISKPIVRFYGASNKLGQDGVIETDRFVMSLTGEENDEVYFNTFTLSGDSSGWIQLAQTGNPVTDGQGFEVTLVSEDGDDYTVDVASTGKQSEALEAVKFRFGNNQTTDMPQCGSTFTATRSLLNGIEVTGLELKIAPIEAGQTLAKGALSMPVRALTTGEWIVSLGIENDKGDLRDGYNGFGVKTGASAMFDLMDARNYTPNLTSFVDLYFPHNQANDPRNYWPHKPMRVAYDIRPSSDVIVWDFNVSYSNAANQTFILNWDAAQFPAADMELTLIDFATGLRLDMLAHTSYSIQTSASDASGTRFFAVLAAVPEEAVAIQPEPRNARDYQLLANYPNPFNLCTTIPYRLARSAEVTLRIYDLKGKLVCTLVNQRQSAGDHRLQWDGRDQQGLPVSTGLYLYQLQTDDQIQTRKMVLMK